MSSCAKSHDALCCSTRSSVSRIARICLYHITGGAATQPSGAESTHNDAAPLSDDPLGRFAEVFKLLEQTARRVEEELHEYMYSRVPLNYTELNERLLRETLAALN